MSKGALSAALRLNTLTSAEDADEDQPSYEICVDYSNKNNKLCDFVASFEHPTRGDEFESSMPSPPSPPPRPSPAEPVCDRILGAVTRALHGGVTLKALWEEAKNGDSCLSAFARDIAVLKDEGLIFLYQRFPFDFEPLNLKFLPVDRLSGDDIVTLFDAPNFVSNMSAIIAIHKRFHPLYYCCSASPSDAESVVTPPESVAAQRSPWREEPEPSLSCLGKGSSEPTLYHRLSARVLSYLARRPGSSAEAVRSALPCASRMHAAALLDSLVRSRKVRMERQLPVSRLRSPFESPFQKSREEVCPPCDILYFIDDL
jgi:hypothetical protein